MAKLSNYGSWNDRFDDRQTYFVGANADQTICSCAIAGEDGENECFSIRNAVNKCNCDQNDPFGRTDSGYITNKVWQII